MGDRAAGAVQGRSREAAVVVEYVSGSSAWVAGQPHSDDEAGKEVLTGVFFAFAYKAAGEFGSVPFFGPAGHGSLSQDLFFSFVTMTTVGYGTLRPGMSGR